MKTNKNQLQKLRRGAQQASLILLAVPLTGIPQAWAQSAQDRARTDAGTIQKSQQMVDEKPALPVPVSKTVIRANQPRVDKSMAGVRMSVKGFRFEGVSGVSADAVEKVLQPYAGRDLSFAEYEEAVHAVARYLRENGHPNAEVRVSRAQVQGGTIAIAIQGLTPDAGPLMAAGPAPTPVEPRVFVKEFRVSGSNAVAQADIDARLAQFTDKALTIKELDDATNTVAGAYRARGFGLAQAFMPPQKIDNGVVAITVQPGIVDGKSGTNGLTVAGGGNVVKQSVVMKVLQPAVKPDEPLNTIDLERVLRIAGEIPGIKSVKTDLSPGSQPGTTQVTANVEEARRVTGTIWADNHGSPYVGTDRINALLNINSPFGYGDLFSLALGKASGMESAKLSGQAFITPAGVKLGASTASMKLDIGQSLAPLNLNSKSTINSVFAGVPLQRSATRNSNLDFTFDAKHFENNLAGVRDNSRRIQLLTGSLSGDLLDNWGGQTAWGASLGMGRVNLSDTPVYQATDAATARTEGSFSKLNLSLARLKSFDSFRPGLSLYTAFTGQLSNGGNLDSAEKFQLGGPTGVRAYPVGEGLGDQGWLATAEVRYSMQPVYGFTPQPFVFADMGGLRQYNQPWPGAVPAGRPNSYNLKGYGVGVSFTRADSASVRIMYAQKIGSNPNPTATGTDSDGNNRGGRIWIFGTINF